MGDGLIANEIHDAAGVTGKGGGAGGGRRFWDFSFFSFSTRHTQMTPSVDNSGLLRNSHPPCKARDRSVSVWGRGELDVKRRDDVR